MARKKRMWTCKIILKNKKNKNDVLEWLKKNKDKDVQSKNRKITKIDKEYVVIIRPKHKFKRTKKENKKGYSIIKGYLK